MLRRRLGVSFGVGPSKKRNLKFSAELVPILSSRAHLHPLHVHSFDFDTCCHVPRPDPRCFQNLDVCALTRAYACARTKMSWQLCSSATETRRRRAGRSWRGQSAPGVPRRKLLTTLLPLSSTFTSIDAGACKEPAALRLMAFDTQRVGVAQHLCAARWLGLWCRRRLPLDCTAQEWCVRRSNDHTRLRYAQQTGLVVSWRETNPPAKTIRLQV